MLRENILELPDPPDHESVRNVIKRVGSEAWRRIRPFLPKLPLLYLLIEIKNQRTIINDSSSWKALLELGLMAIAKHEHARTLYARLLDALSAKGDQGACEILEAVTPGDGLLALEMLDFMSDLLDETNHKEEGLRLFELQILLADILGITGNKAITYHQLGFFLLRQNDVSGAEEALKKAALGFQTNAPELFRKTNRLRIIIYSLRLHDEPGLSLPDDLEQFLEHDSIAVARINIARAKGCIDKDDLINAEKYLLEAKRFSKDEENLPYQILLVEARLMRRKGQPEQADFLRREAASLLPYENHSDELKWEAFYFARDHDLFDQAKRVLVDIKDTDSYKINYQQALIAIQEGDSETARKLFLGCLENDRDEFMVANCYGMLALIEDDSSQAQEYIHKAIGLFLKLDKPLDHAICLSHLGLVEMFEGLRLRQSRFPNLAISQFPRAENYFKKALEIAESIGVDSFCVQLMTYQGHLEVARGREMVAFDHFEKARLHLELVYLRMASPELFSKYSQEYTQCCLVQIECALRADNLNFAFVAAERSKARRMLRDVSEAWLAAHIEESEGVSGPEKLVLDSIQPLRKKILEGRPMSAIERRELHESEERFGRLCGEFGSVKIADENIEYINEPLGINTICSIVFDEKLEIKKSESEDLSYKEREEPEELPGGGTIECEHCGVLNRIGSSFCSACESLLPKSATLNLNLLLGEASEEELKIGFAEHLYNMAVHEFADGNFKEAEQLLNNAMEHHIHPDYSFFHGMCRLTGEDKEGALQDFNQIRSLQFAGPYPFWPLPVSPKEFLTNVESLEKGDCSSIQVFQNLLSAYQNFLTERSSRKYSSDD